MRVTTVKCCSVPDWYTLQTLQSCHSTTARPRHDMHAGHSMPLKMRQNVSLHMVHLPNLRMLRALQGLGDAMAALFKGVPGMRSYLWQENMVFMSKLAKLFRVLYSTAMRMPST